MLIRVWDLNSVRSILVNNTTHFYSQAFLSKRLEEKLWQDRGGFVLKFDSVKKACRTLSKQEASDDERLLARLPAPVFFFAPRLGFACTGALAPGNLLGGGGPGRAWDAGESA